MTFERYSGHICRGIRKSNCPLINIQPTKFVVNKYLMHGVFKDIEMVALFYDRKAHIVRVIADEAGVRLTRSKVGGGQISSVAGFFKFFGVKLKKSQTFVPVIDEDTKSITIDISEIVEKNEDCAPLSGLP